MRNKSIIVRDKSGEVIGEFAGLAGQGEFLSLDDFPVNVEEELEHARNLILLSNGVVSVETRAGYIVHLKGENWQPTYH